MLQSDCDDHFLHGSFFDGFLADSATCREFVLVSSDF